MEKNGQEVVFAVVGFFTVFSFPFQTLNGIISSNENTINNEFPSEPSSNDLFSYAWKTAPELLGELCANNSFNTNISSVNKKSRNDYKEIVYSIMNVINRELDIDVKPENLVYEVKKMIYSKEEKSNEVDIEEYNDAIKYKKFCTSVMRKNNINKFEDFQTYITGLTQQKDIHNKYLKSLKRILSEQPESNIRSKMKNY